jgi:hypothetical protein
MLENDDPDKSVDEYKKSLRQQERLRQQLVDRLFIKARPNRQRKRNNQQAVISQRQNVFVFRVLFQHFPSAGC